MARKVLQIRTNGLKRAFEKFHQFGAEGVKAFEEITAIKANEIEAEAKLLAPIDTGKLRQNIMALEVTPLHWVIAALMPYSAYMEFGTGTKVNIPPELSGVASQFKGRGIRQVNIRPRPYLWPAYKRGRKLYVKDLNTALEMLADKFNKP